MGRCRWAIHFGVALHTRCFKPAGHGPDHVGQGLEQFTYQRIEWIAGDRREYETDRPDDFAWEET